MEVYNVKYDEDEVIAREVPRNRKLLNKRTTVVWEIFGVNLFSWVS
jgi:hypothetical protein